MAKPSNTGTDLLILAVVGAGAYLVYRWAENNQYVPNSAAATGGASLGPGPSALSSSDLTDVGSDIASDLSSVTEGLL